MAAPIAVLRFSRICQPFLAPYIAMKSQSIRKDTIGSFSPFSCCQILRLLQFESQRKKDLESWSLVADDPSVPLLPKAHAASKTNQAKRISSHLRLQLRSEERETPHGSSVLIWLLLRTCDAVLTGPARNCTSFTPLATFGLDFIEAHLGEII
jgi:hypothetical protein